MVETLAKELDERQRPFVGREPIVERISEFARAGDCVVIFVHGIPGIGKSELLAEVAKRAWAQGVTVLQLDCGAIEPTNVGVLDALGTAVGQAIDGVTDITGAVAGAAAPRLLLLDGYETWTLLDAWVRTELVPRLPDETRVVFASRYEPASPWRYERRWQEALSVLELGPLDEEEALELLREEGVPADPARRLNASARGHPLALTLAASALRDDPSTSIDEAASAGVVGGLAVAYLQSVRDRLSRAALEAASVTRRVTRPLLAEQLGDDQAEPAYRRLAALPFVRSAADGLAIHEAAKEAISQQLSAADPARHRELRRAAWRELQAELTGVGVAELWRYTADILYLLQNPVLRAGFFPTTSPSVALEPAAARDHEEVRRLSRQLDGPESVALIDAWIETRPDLLAVVRDTTGDVVGFRWSIASNEVDADLAARDPVLAAWLTDLAASDDADVPAFFLRRWLTADGETPGEVQALCWIDCKRTYLEMRPNLGHVYIGQRDFSPFMPALTTLGFRRLPTATVEIDGAPFHSVVSRLGPGSVDGWLSRLVARELGIDPNSMLDEEARQLVLDGERIPLSPLEANLMRYLLQHRGAAVSHADLIEAIWGYEYTGDSNVDAVAIRALRSKLGPHASLIETVRGVGYRLKP